MRSRGRLADLMRTVNVKPRGQDVDSWMFQSVADFLEGNPKGKWDIGRQAPIREQLRTIADPRSEYSEYIQEMAGEAFHYLEEDANGRQDRN